MVRLLLSIVVAIGFAVALVATLHSTRGRAAPHQEWRVTTAVDTVDGTFCDVQHCSLREAILSANARPGPDTILLPPGIYTLTRAGTDNNAEQGDLDITADLTITPTLPAQGRAVRAGQNNQVVVDANGLDRVFDVLADVNFTLVSMTLRNGDAGDETGGGLRNFGNTFLLNVAIEDSRGGAGGGGLFNAGKVILFNSRLTGNQAESGGAIANGGLLEMDTTTIADNSATFGGGIFNAQQASASVQDSTLTGNQAPNGGNLYNNGHAVLTNVQSSNGNADSGAGFYNGPSGEAHLQQGEISDNSATSQGGGLFNGGTIYVTDTVIYGNAAAFIGGGVYNFADSRLDVTDSTLQNNQARFGGGLASDGVTTLDRVAIANNAATEHGGGLYINQGEVLIQNTTISGNQAQGDGGGLFATNPAESGQAQTVIDLLNVTIAANLAVRNGAGLFIKPLLVTLKIINTILADACAGTIESLGHNIIQDSAVCPIATVASDQVNIDPQLNSLADNGGDTLTHALSPTSPALDKANDNRAPAVDQRNVSRPQGAGADIGAYERRVAPSGDCGDPAIAIHMIQGDAASSPLEGQNVVVEGIVSANYESTLGGFFMQETDGDFDADPNTSEGIFVSTDALTFTLSTTASHRVRVAGTVEEYATAAGGQVSSRTQLSNITAITPCGSHSIQPHVVTLPTASDNSLESMEGMWVTVPQDLSVIRTFNLGRFGEIHIATARLYDPTHLTDPGPTTQALQTQNDRSRIVLDDGSDAQNPLTFLYPTTGLSATNSLRAGDMVEGITGVVDHAFGAYRLHATTPPSIAVTNPRPDNLPPREDALRVASFNVLNYFATIDTGEPRCGPQQNLDCRGADSQEEQERQRAKLVSALTGLDADIYGLQELENDSDDRAVQDLVTALNATTPGQPYALIPTGAIGTDAIKVALIYNQNRISPVGNFALLDSSVDARFDDLKNRPALAQTFAETAGGERFTLINLHLKSRGSPCDDVGDPDTGDGQGNCNQTRTNAMAAVRDWAATDPTGSQDDDYLLLGSLYGGIHEDPINVLEQAGYTNLGRRFSQGSVADYSFEFDGQFGLYDNMLSSPALSWQVLDWQVWHINADEPRVLDYNTEFQTPDQQATFYNDGPFRSSDHDPVVAEIQLDTAPNLEIQKTAPAVVARETPISYTLTVRNTGNLTATNLVIVDPLPANAHYLAGSGGVLDAGQVVWGADLLAPQHAVQVSFAVTATQTIVNQNYRVRADGDLQAGGPPLSTQIFQGIYLPTILK